MSIKQTSYTYPVLNGQYQAGWNNNQNLIKNTHLLCMLLQVLKVLIKIIKKKKKTLWPLFMDGDSTASRLEPLRGGYNSFYCCFTPPYTLVDITFYKFLKLHSTLSEKFWRLDGSRVLGRICDIFLYLCCKKYGTFLITFYWYLFNGMFSLCS